MSVCARARVCVWGGGGGRGVAVTSPPGSTTGSSYAICIQ